MMQQFRVSAPVGKKVWQALARASDHDSEIRAFLFAVRTVPADTRFLAALRALFRQYDPIWWCETIETLVLQGWLSRKDGSAIQEKLLHFVGPLGTWK